jgi:Phd_YefM.
MAYASGMGKRITASQLRQNIYRILDEVIETGRPVEIERKGKVVRIETERQEKSIFETLTPHPGSIVGDSEDLVHVDWSQEWKPDLP